MQKLINLLTWFDNNIVKILVTGFIFIAPLYPKFPLKFIEYTYIAVRLEDVYIGIMTLIFCIQILRKKESINWKFAVPFLIYWVAILLSFIWGYFIQHSIREQLFQVGLLHTMRRVEYMIVFFIAASTVRSKREFIRYIYVFMLVLGLVCMYGIGQKFLGWPAVQTMNPAFAKGLLLYLTAEARVSSTFAGHYDLAAYLVLLIPLALAFYEYKKNILAAIPFALAIFVLTLTASRSSFGAYIASIVAFVIYVRKPRLIVVAILATILSSLFSTNLIQRYFKTFQVKQIFVNENTGKVVIPQKITTKELPAGTFYIPKDESKNQTASDNDEALVKEELLHEIRKEASASGTVLTASQEARLLATASAGLTVKETYVADISFATRLQVEWPRAINMFRRNPLLGGGASSITEATDGDYFRWIGEFGLLGTLSFLYILYLIIASLWKQAQRHTSESILYYGFIFGFIGLFINASYIDVFEASKVAYTFWTLAGIFVGSLAINNGKEKV